MKEVIFQVVGNAVVLGIFGYIVKQYVANQKARLNSHSKSIDSLSERTTRTEEQLKSNEKNDANMLEAVKVWIQAELNPIKEDLRIIKNKP